MKENVNQIPNQNVVQQRMVEFLKVLKDTPNNIQNNWNSKQREKYIYDKVISSLSFIIPGDFILKNKKCVEKLKSVYTSSDPSSFTTMSLLDYFEDIDVNSIYFILEPFGPKASPDFLFISSKGTYGIEEKSSANGKITFNTGTPGGNKVIMYYDRKENKIYLTSGPNWGWTGDIEREYREFTKEMIDYCKNRFQEKFGDRLSQMDYYARPMLVDKNQIKNIWDKDEKDVMDMLDKYI